MLKAYIDLFDPGLWLMRAARCGEGTRAEELQALAAVMERAALHERLTRIWRVLTRDYMDLANALREHRRRTRQAGAQPIAVDATSRDVMHLLHALRIVLIQRLYLLATHVPEFSGRHELTRDSLIARLIQLDVEAAVAKLGEIFPIVDPTRLRRRLRRARDLRERREPVLRPGARPDLRADRQALHADPSDRRRDNPQCRYAWLSCSRVQHRVIGCYLPARHCRSG